MSDAGAPNQRSRLAETLQQALRNFTGGQGPGALSPGALEEIARRAGISNPDQLADLARMVGVQPAGAAPGAQHLIFALGPVECALPTEAVQGVERVGEIAHVPNTAAWVLGVIQLRGSICSVVDLKAFLGMPTTPVTARSKLLIVSSGEMTIGMLVDGVAEMRSLVDAPISPNVPGWAAAYAAGVTQVEGRALILFDPERLLFSDKMGRYRSDAL